VHRGSTLQHPMLVVLRHRAVMTQSLCSIITKRSVASQLIGAETMHKLCMHTTRAAMPCAASNCEPQIPAAPAAPAHRELGEQGLEAPADLRSIMGRCMDMDMVITEGKHKNTHDVTCRNGRPLSLCRLPIAPCQQLTHVSLNPPSRDQTCSILIHHDMASIKDHSICAPDQSKQHTSKHTTIPKWQRLVMAYQLGMQSWPLRTRTACQVCVVCLRLPLSRYCSSQSLRPPALPCPDLLYAATAGCALHCPAPALQKKRQAHHT
jgi:hypothetical protein